MFSALGAVFIYFLFFSLPLTINTTEVVYISSRPILELKHLLQQYLSPSPRYIIHFSCINNSTLSYPILNLLHTTTGPLARTPFGRPGDGAGDHPSGQRAGDGWSSVVCRSDRQASGHGLLRGAVPDVQRARRRDLGAPVPTTVLRGLRRVQGTELLLG